MLVLEKEKPSCEIPLKMNKTFHIDLRTGKSRSDQLSSRLGPKPGSCFCLSISIKRNLGAASPSVSGTVWTEAQSYEDRVAGGQSYP